MNYHLLTEIIHMAEQFELETQETGYENNIQGFVKWAATRLSKSVDEPDWEGKGNGRSAESTISTMIVHLNRYAKNYARSAIWGSDFSTQEDFIYLITLKSFGAMTKIELIKRNIQEKSAGMLVINRLIKKGLIDQNSSDQDRRSKVINISNSGLRALDNQMHKIRQATKLVVGDLDHAEKMDLIRLLGRLNNYHQLIYERNIAPEKLLDEVNRTI